MFNINPCLTREEFDAKVRSLLQTDEQIECHNNYLLALLTKTSFGDSPERESEPEPEPKPVPSKIARQGNNKGVFESGNYAEYVQTKIPNRSSPLNYSYPRAAAELFAPYSGLIACRVNIAAWECGMDGAQSGVTPILAQACQTFLKNIITAMISKAKGFKMRDKKFQYGFNTPIPDAYIRNSNNMLDDSIDGGNVDEERLQPKCPSSLERTEWDRAFAYAASKKIRNSVTLDTKLLYATVRDNPKLFGLHGMHSVQVLKMSLHGDNDQAFIENLE
ncbi:transcriptional adapter 1-like [Euwallacea similis]|uniref:transcriptional adapter 1-like n=1 Tax=Euwallacea similis TaxID=1736056 RepID=UPI00344C8447